jgi:hypothetical protein
MQKSNKPYALKTLPTIQINQARITINQQLQPIFENCAQLYSLLQPKR